MAPLFHDPSLVHHNNDIGSFGGGEPVCDRDRGPTFAQPFKRLGHSHFSLGVNSARCLVEDEQSSIGKLRSHEGNELTLTDRDPLSSFTCGGL